MRKSCKQSTIHVIQCCIVCTISNFVTDRELFCAQNTHTKIDSRDAFQRKVVNCTRNTIIKNQIEKEEGKTLTAFGQIRYFQIWFEQIVKLNCQNERNIKLVVDSSYSLTKNDFPFVH